MESVTSQTLFVRPVGFDRLVGRLVINRVYYEEKVQKCLKWKPKKDIVRTYIPGDNVRTMSALNPSSVFNSGKKISTTEFLYKRAIF